MNVCLVRPPAVESFRFVTTTVTLPLGLAYIAAALREAGHSLSILDAVAEGPTSKTRYYKGTLLGLPLEEIAARVPPDADLVGITVIFSHEWPAVARLVSLIKTERPDLRVVLGGEHVTSMPEFCLATSQADYVVLGEGEESIVELVSSLEESSDLDPISGIGWRREAAIVINPRRARRRDVDSIAYPAWDLFDLETYSGHRLVGSMDTGLKHLPLLATRGCPYQCTFCSSPNMWNPNWIPRDPVKVVDEIQHHVETYGARSFPFQDLTAIIRKDWIVRFCNEILARGLEISWQLPSGTRCEAVDAEVASLMKRTGMASLAYAPESGSEETRRIIKKQMKTEDLLESVRATGEADLNASTFMVIGFPHDTAESLRENIPFLKEIRRAGMTDMGVGYYFALPGTELFDSLYDAGKIKLDAKYFGHILQGGDLIPSVSHCEHLSRWDLVKWKFHLYLTFYRTPSGRRRPTKKKTGLVANIWRAVSGLFSSSHDSKLQTVFRTAMRGGWDELRLAATRGWMPRSEEKRFFADWDAIYRRIRSSLLEQKVAATAPRDTTVLHRSNVMKALKPLQATQRTVEAPRPALASNAPAGPAAS